MRILFISHAFNSLSQRLYVELSDLGHELSVEFDINDSVTEEAVSLFRPDLILAPYLRRAIPESIWRQHVCLIVHPGIVGDRGPSALDWAILNDVPEWGVTVLQAEAEMDAGPVWASETFAMRPAMKSSLYRNEVTEAAVRAVLKAIEHFPEYLAGHWRPAPVPMRPMHALLKQTDRAIDWSLDASVTVLRKLRSADGFPGVIDSLFGQPCRLYNGHSYQAEGQPGAILGRAGDGVVRATLDGAVWIGHARLEGGIKLPVSRIFPAWLTLDELDISVNPVRYAEIGRIGILHFNFYNGAMGTDACRELRNAYRAAQQRPTRIIILAGGVDFFSNGLDLNRIEAADSAPDESWRNIEAMDDLCQTIIETDNHLTVAALQGNAGAGGSFLALAADRVWARNGCVLNPHYKNMGNLYGSEYWTYLLPKRIDPEKTQQIMHRRQPMGTREAKALGFIDDCFGDTAETFLNEALRRATDLAAAPDFSAQLAVKRAQRIEDEAVKPLAKYRSDELARMQRNFYGFDPSYHVARHHFVAKTLHSWTPRHLARHREPGWTIPEVQP
jgi:putative two-component system hydrogenase maturation factor HypX/HoxX